MSKETEHLRSADLRSIYLLIGECCELGADPLLWRNHMLSRLNQLFNAASSIMVDAVYDPDMTGIGARANLAFSGNQYSLSEREVLMDCIKSMPIEANPLGPALLKECHSSAPIAVARKDRIGEAEWKASRFVSDYFSPIGWYDMMMAMIPKINGFQCVNFSREKTAANFIRRQSKLLQLFVNEIEAISEVRLAGFETSSLLTLPPRERQVLMALSEGDDEKQVAVRLGITRSTVHEYVRRLFHRYCVNSRSQLLISATRQIHADRIAKEVPEDFWLYRRSN